MLTSVLMLDSLYTAEQNVVLDKSAKIHGMLFPRWAGENAGGMEKHDFQ